MCNTTKADDPCLVTCDTTKTDDLCLVTCNATDDVYFIKFILAVIHVVSRSYSSNDSYKMRPVLWMDKTLRLAF